MRDRYIGPVLALIAVVFVWISMPAIGDAVTAYRADTKTQSFNSVATAAGVTNSSQTLQYALYDADVESVIALTSDLSTDNPIAGLYTSASKTLRIDGLTANTSRNLSASYLNGRLDGSTDTFAGIVPFFFLGLTIIIFLGLTFKAVIG